MEREQSAGETGPDGEQKEGEHSGEAEPVRVWMVERTYAADEHNVVITYATPDGARYLRQNRTKRVLVDPTTAALDVSPDRLEAVEDPERRARYAAEAARMSDRHDPDDEV